MQKNNNTARVILCLALTLPPATFADNNFFRIGPFTVTPERLIDTPLRAPVEIRLVEPIPAPPAADDPTPIDLAREELRLSGQPPDNLRLDRDFELIPWSNWRPQLFKVCDPLRTLVLRPSLRAEDFPCLDWPALVHWVRQDGTVEPYLQWPQARKDRLNALFTAIVSGDESLGLQCPDPGVSRFYLTEAQALDVYLAHVAHALALEYGQVLPWRLHRMPTAELVELLSPGAYAQPIPVNAGSIQYPPNMSPGQGYRLPFRQSQTAGFVCDPRVGFRFMTGQWPGQTEQLIGGNEEETLARLSAWFRDEVGHGGGDPSEIVQHALLKDRLVRYTNTDGLTSYWAIKGCQSAANTLADLARSVNIPLLRVGSHDAGASSPTSTHAGLLFRWARTDPLVLYHADELYAINYDWVVFPTVGTRTASRDEKNSLFFAANWTAPFGLRNFGFDYYLVKVRSTHLNEPTCSSSYFCDVEDYGWQIGGWKLGSRENPDPKSVTQKWNAYFNQLKTRIMSDGKPCWTPTDWYHPECKDEVELMHSKIYGDYYKQELVRGYELAKNAALGAWTLVSRYCDTRNTPTRWQEYVDREQGQPSPNNYSWTFYRDRAAEVVNAYGGCSAVEAATDATMKHKLRP